MNWFIAGITKHYSRIGKRFNFDVGLGYMYMYVKVLRDYALYFWTGLRKTSWRWNLNKNGLFQNYCNKNCLNKTVFGDMQLHS